MPESPGLITHQPELEYDPEFRRTQVIKQIKKFIQLNGNLREQMLCKQNLHEFIDNFPIHGRRYEGFDCSEIVSGIMFDNQRFRRDTFRQGCEVNFENSDFVLELSWTMMSCTKAGNGVKRRSHWIRRSWSVALDSLLKLRGISMARSGYLGFGEEKRLRKRTGILIRIVS